MKKEFSAKQKFYNFVAYLFKTSLKQKWNDVTIFYNIDVEEGITKRRKIDAEQLLYKGAVVYDLDVPACITEIFRSQNNMAFPIDTINCEHFSELGMCPMANCPCYVNKYKFTKIAQKYEKLKQDKQYFWTGKFAQAAKGVNQK